MAPRIGLDQQAVVAGAIDLVDREGVEQLTLSRLAHELGIRTPSLYAHVEGQRDLWRLLWLFSVEDLGEALRTSVMGRSRDDALFGFAAAFRAYALTFPGRYQITLRPPRPMDEDAHAARRRANDAFHAVMRSYGVDKRQEQLVGRAIRAAIHGFVTLEMSESFGENTSDLDGDFHHMVELLARGLKPAAKPSLKVARG